ncbi:toll-like receptor 4 [Saccostrea echinata]|uniref:toll-like receptor 4 n=1 Tax=Saccostrea echinata TaxID=191078 RepID=UPI002A832B38|nr:toll-like receptor 4 [Saccostrea echinata]
MTLLRVNVIVTVGWKPFYALFISKYDKLIIPELIQKSFRKGVKRQSSKHVFDHLHSLKVLDLSYNWITSLHIDMLVFMSNIEHLNLSNNEIKSVTFDLSAALKLRSIDLSSNKIVMLDSKSMDFLDASREKQLSIQMSSNLLQCENSAFEEFNSSKTKTRQYYIKKMSFVATILFYILVAFLKQSQQLSCSSEPQCRCFIERGMLSVDCSSLNLTHSPKFEQNVRCIYLNNNGLTDIPTDMPQEIVRLDISDNNIRNPKKASLSRYKNLQWLNIEHNCLWQRYMKWPSRFFENLTKLDTLLMKDTCSEIPESKIKEMKYSKEGFYGLPSLRHIELNGLGGHNFEDAFEKNNSIQVLAFAKYGGLCVLNSIENDTFNIFQQLKHLQLSTCNIKYIEKGAFEELNDLEFLDISNNQDLTISVLSNITHDLQYSNIQTLKANLLQCTNGLSMVLRISHIKYLRNTSLKELSLVNNRIGIIQHLLTRHLPKTLKYLNMNDNPLIYGIYLLEGDFLSNLERLDIDKTLNDTYHETGCKYTSNSCDNKEEELTVEGTEYKESPAVFSYQLPPKLKSLSIANQKMYLPLINSNYGITSRNSLTHLHIQGNLIYDIQHFSGLWRLEYLDVSNNFCSNITKQPFQDMSNLFFLNLSRNLLGKELKRQSSEHVFDHLRGLKVLDLSYNWITHLHKDLFVFTSNIEHLNISNNEIESVTFDLSAALKLRSIDLSSNKIVMLDSKSMDFLDSSRQKQLSIQMSNNPLQCTCQSMEFLKWMQESSNKHFVDRENYTCTFTDGKKIELRHLEQIITSLERECTSFTTTIVIVTIILLVTIIFVTSAIMYRYRWRLRYLYYAGKRSYKGYSRILDTGREYQFDAFISYSESERTEFIPNLLKLERENNFKFCIHSRDFIIGVNVAENITNAIHNSKHTVCFLSKAFLESEFCIYEAQMARMESIYRGGETTLLIVLVDKDLGVVLPPFLKDVIREQTYLEYDKEIKEEFWNALAQALREM